ncbi:ArsR/SmtB family transcription factor [Phenylobacterium sp.]|uniref:ArsR/SmtB family transcription factor n=1 Tax=Phenylobacterium sp. TaxID=1871053 RepID=UPI00391951F0
MTGKPGVETLAEDLRALAHPARLRILACLAAGELAVREIERRSGLRQPALSQQLAELRRGGWVATRREARSVLYRRADGRMAGLIEAVQMLTGAAGSPSAAPAPAPCPRTQAAVFAVTGERAA